MGIFGYSRRHIIDGEQLPKMKKTGEGVQPTWPVRLGISKPLSELEKSPIQFRITQTKEQREMMDERRRERKETKGLYSDKELLDLIKASIGSGAEKVEQLKAYIPLDDPKNPNTKFVEVEVCGMDKNDRFLLKSDNVPPGLDINYPPFAVHELIFEAPTAERIWLKPEVITKKSIEQVVKPIEVKSSVERVPEPVVSQPVAEKKAPVQERSPLPEAPIDILRRRVKAGETVIAYIPPVRRDDAKLKFIEVKILTVGDDNKIKVIGEASNPANFRRGYFITELEFNKPAEERIYRKPIIKESLSTRTVVKEPVPKTLVLEPKRTVVEVATERAVLLEQALNKDYLVLKEYLGYTPDIKIVLTQLLMDEQVLWKDAGWFLDYLNKVLAKLNPVFINKKYTSEKKGEIFAKIYQQNFGDGNFSVEKRRNLLSPSAVADEILGKKPVEKTPKPEAPKVEKIETRDLTKMFEVALKMDYHSLSQVFEICANDGAPGLMGIKLYQAMQRSTLTWQEWKPAINFLETAMQKFLNIFGPGEKTNQERILMTDFYSQYFQDNNFSPEKVQGLPNAEQAVEEFLKSQVKSTS